MKSTFLTFLLLALMACDKSPMEPNNPDNRAADPVGTLVADFPITHGWLPTSKIIRTDLHIAFNALEMYKGNYVQSANLFDSQEKYSFTLPPGSYYLEAAIACLCEGDSCSAAGFPGNKWGQKHASYRFNIVEGEITEVLIRFLQ
jgi:hypothetical protein